jgi:transcriptional regulator with XRE-family HTH domain
MLVRVRAELGWSLSEAGRRTGISRRMLGMMEAGQRVPSAVLAEELISGYKLGYADADLLRFAALPNVGRASPLRAGSPALVDPGGLTPPSTRRFARNRPRVRLALIEQLTRPAERFVRPGTESGTRAGGTQCPPWA